MEETQTGSDDLRVQHHGGAAGGAFYVVRGGARIAEMTYSRSGERAVIEHTRVDESLRGQGVARKLLDAAVAWARETGTRVEPVCTYARSVFERDASIRDVLAAG
jgi:hypothetical protein